MFPLYLVDAFTSVAFAGNPAGVCLPPGEVTAEWMQLVAREMNQAETAFLRPRGDGSWDLRWFTPTIEVDLCGHATLASAHLLWATSRADQSRPIHFHTRSGLLSCVRVGDQIEMDFPAEPPTPASVPGLAEAIGLEPLATLQNRMDVLAVLPDEVAVTSLQPDLARMALIPARGVIVTARSERPGIDFISRFFAPQSGVPEDPVTGSAHCCLAPYWQAILDRPGGELTALQVSVRGGRVGMRCRGDRITLIGQAIITLAGELLGGSRAPGLA